MQPVQRSCREGLGAQKPVCREQRSCVDSRAGDEAGTVCSVAGARVEGNKEAPVQCQNLGRAQLMKNVRKEKNEGGRGGRLPEDGDI